MRLSALILVLALASCGPALARRPNGPLCDPKTSILLGGDPDAVSFGYLEALDTLQNDLGFERPGMCDVTVAIWPISTPEGVQSACHNADAEACVNVDPDDGFYLLRYLESQPEHLRHEWLHVMLSELRVDRDQHHRLMNRADVYYYPHGKNPDDE